MKTFAEHLNDKYGIPGTVKRKSFEAHAKKFVDTEVLKNVIKKKSHPERELKLMHNCLLVFCCK